MSDIEKNTVSAKNQLAGNSIISYENKDGDDIRILFVGNSITRHAPKADIGWYGDWGMAASSKDKDYVHIVIKKVLEKRPDASFCICQASEWERGYFDGEKALEKFADAHDFGADIVIFRIIENCRTNVFDSELFLKEYKRFVSWLCEKKNARVIATDGFWRHEKGDEMIKKAAEEEGYTLVNLGDLGDAAENKAIGLFEHEGVALHPGDKGMEAIAERIFEAIDKLI